MPATPAWQRASRTLLIDGTTIEVSRALQAASVPHLLLKGPVTAGWLYDIGEFRGYRDTDLLVSPTDRERAGAVLASLGFEDWHACVLGLYRPDNERAWRRGRVTVDLHTRLVGVPPSSAGRAWDALSERAEDFVLHGTVVPTLDRVARCMHLALHVAQSARDPRAEEDLVRGLVAEPVVTWQGAAELAERLGAKSAFAAGLSSLRAGRAVREAIAVVDRPTPAVFLNVRGALPEAGAVARLGEAPRAERRAVVLGWFSRTPGVDESVSRRGEAWLRVVAGLRLLAGTAEWVVAVVRCRAGSARTPERPAP